ncbi:hypothetical protein JCM1393_21250 [Clostridium carnis]
MNTLGENIKYYRESMELSKKELSLVSGLGRSTIIEIESNLKNNIKLSTLCGLCKVFNITPNDLIPEHLYQKEWGE